MSDLHSSTEFLFVPEYNRHTHGTEELAATARFASPASTNRGTAFIDPGLVFPSAKTYSL